MYEWRRSNACSFQYNGLINLVGNKRIVTMAACVKSIRGLYPDTTDFATVAIFFRPCQIWLLKRVRHRAFEQLDAGNN